MLILMGWLAQLCLPLAHAALMADRGPRVAAWCGQDSPALQSKFAELPTEIREILEGSLGHGEQLSDTCASFCVTPHAVVAPEPPPTVALRAAGIESLVNTTAGEQLLAPRSNTPPVRGPPERT